MEKFKKIIGKFGRLHAFLIVLGSIALQYPVMEYIAELRPERYLPMWIDQYVPFWPPAVWAYFTYYPLLIIPFLVIKDVGILKKGVRAFIYVLIMTDVFYLFCPFWMVRPDEGFTPVTVSEKLLSYVWQVDNPANVFPSQHVAVSFISALIFVTAFKTRAKLSIFYLLMASVVAVSIVFVKQHYVWDIFGGLVVAFGAYYLVFVKDRV